MMRKFLRMNAKKTFLFKNNSYLCNPNEKKQFLKITRK
jgi:hypothetical protein